MQNPLKAALLTAVLAAGLSLPSAAKEITAPFGWVWGQTKAELQAKGVIFKCNDGDNDGEFTKICWTENPPKSLPSSFVMDTRYRVQFHLSEGLIEAGMVSVGFGDEMADEDDYARLKASLTAKYGAPSYEEPARANNIDVPLKSTWIDNVGGIIELNFTPFSASSVRLSSILQLRYKSKEFTKIENDAL